MKSQRLDDSDEGGFISHMVQIILSLIVTLLKYCRFFISHMVQIIPISTTSLQR